jgi:hypothetical protein
MGLSHCLLNLFLGSSQKIFGTFHCPRGAADLGCPEQLFSIGSPSIAFRRRGWE